MSTTCPHCDASVVQARNRDGPNFCPHCQRLFEIQEDHHVPRWVYGVMMVLVCNLQIIGTT